MRLFVSVDLPDEFSTAVADVQEHFEDASGLDFTDPAQAHFTLKFLGEVSEDELPAVEDAVGRAVDSAATGPFEAGVGGVGVFPSLDYIRVLWVGVREGHGDAELTTLAEALERELTDIGFDPEAHDFTPHATIARMRHAAGKEAVQEGVRTLDPDVGTMDVTEVRLKESELTQEGPVYSTVASFSL